MKRATVSRQQFLLVLALCVFSTAVGFFSAYMTRPRVAPAAPRDALVLDPLATPPIGYEWTRLPEPHFPIPPFAEHLRDLHVAIDPGHAGQRQRAGFKVSRSGRREATMNLAVAHRLREFLLAAGAKVTLTRDAESESGLSDDAEIDACLAVAERADADLLLSIHHDTAENAGANYTRVFYHGAPDKSAASVCLARHVAWGLADALRLEQQQPVPIASDLARYSTGLKLLRLAKMPAVLSEASFYSNEEEERRLADPVYNRREAYGLFLGLARFAYCGLPGVSIAERRGGELRLKLDDGLSSRGGFTARTPKIMARSIVVELGSTSLPFTYDAIKSELRVTLPTSATGAELFVDFENVFGQHVLRPRIALR